MDNDHNHAIKLATKWFKDNKGYVLKCSLQGPDLSYRRFLDKSEKCVTLFHSFARRNERKPRQPIERSLKEETQNI